MKKKMRRDCTNCGAKNREEVVVVMKKGRISRIYWKVGKLRIEKCK